jgi:hypothetical protein
LLGVVDGGDSAEIRQDDYARLLGFEAVAEEISGSVDFQDETISAKLGAKVSAGAWRTRQVQTATSPKRSTLQSCWALMDSAIKFQAALTFKMRPTTRSLA